MVVALLGQDSQAFLSGILKLFPLFFAALTLCSQQAHFIIRSFVAQFSYKMKRAATGSFVQPDIHATISVPTCLSVYVAPNLAQFARFEAIIPDPYSCRFGLRTDIIKSAESAHYFMNWSPSQTSESTTESVHQKKFIICKLLITSLGYMTLMEEGDLEKDDGHNHHRQGYYRWWGPLC